MKEFWDERYSQDQFAYGEEPNAYLREKLPHLKAGKVLFPAEGEGRNAVFAAQLGWQVSAFDYSAKGKEKAEELASKKNVKIDYSLSGFLEESYEKEEFHAICMTFVHFDPKIKTEMHKRLDSYLKPGGHIIFEAFSKEHREINKVNPDAGGPKDIHMMYSIEEIERDFSNYDIIELKKELVHLKEGFGHVGEGSLIRFIGKKRFNID
ncbi:class I SAM-dependent methyltransferase [Marinifilum flexuosum]|uniref:class I SAM-dependent methyltransferase n=1 Tax=Marinifilum flexuosum TaxID=1117708 RepID=UPI002493E05E|nr:class I SAM-dependent methyltransferase [Marinifilum flexuosum]